MRLGGTASSAEHPVAAAATRLDVAKLASNWGVQEDVILTAATQLEAEWGGERSRPFLHDDDVVTGLTLLYAKKPAQLFMEDTPVALRMEALAAVLGSKGQSCTPE